MRSHAALKIRPAGSSLFVVRVRRDFDAVVHGSLDIARFVVEISTLGIRGGNGSIHSRTQSPRLQEQTPRTLTGGRTSHREAAPTMTRGDECCPEQGMAKNSGHTANSVIRVRRFGCAAFRRRLAVLLSLWILTF